MSDDYRIPAEIILAMFNASLITRAEAREYLATHWKIGNGLQSVVAEREVRS